MPGIRSVGWATFQRARPADSMRPHAHESCYEISYIVRGSVDWWAADQAYEVGPGHLFITRPGEKHGGVGGVMNPCELYTIQLKVLLRGRMAGVSLRDARSLVRDLDAMKHRCFPASAQTPTLFERILAEHREPSPYSNLLVGALLQEFLIVLVRDYSTHVEKLAAAPAKPSPSGPAPAPGTAFATAPGTASATGTLDGTLDGAIKEVVCLIDRCVEDPPTVVELADRAGMSVSHFRQLFRQQVGFSPSEYLMRCRIRVAKRQLSSGDSVTQIAFALGFSSSQHFATAFMKWVGMTPTEYRKLAEGQGA